MPTLTYSLICIARILLNSTYLLNTTLNKEAGKLARMSDSTDEELEPHEQ